MSASERHPPGDDFAGYFRGLLPPHDARALEEHVAICGVCAERLQVEAQVELAMHEAQAATRATPSRTRALTRAAAVLVPVFAAAVAIAVLRTPSRPRPGAHLASSAPACTGSAPCSDDPGKETTMSKKTISAALLALSPFAPVVGCSNALSADPTGVATSQPLLQPFVPGPLPDGWVKKGGDQDAYAMGTDPNVVRDARPVLSVQSKRPSDSFGTVRTMVDAASHRGKRLRLRGLARTQDVSGHAGFWMRIDGQDNQEIAIDNMADRPICGTTDWRTYDVVLDVPKEAQAIYYGVLLGGEGRLWADDLRLDEVDPSVHVTNEGARIQGPSGPNVPPTWVIGRSHPEEYDVTADPDVHHASGSSLRAISRSLRQDAYVSLMQFLPPKDFVGKHVRFTAYLRVADVKGWAGLWIFASGRDTSKDVGRTMQDRPLVGTSDWQKLSIDLDVPADATYLSFGAHLIGEGQMWLDDVSLMIE